MKRTALILSELFITFFFISGMSNKNPINSALDKFKLIQSYSATLYSSGEDEVEIIHYAFKKPGYIRMDFIKPHKGAVLAYLPDKKKVKLRPFGVLKPFVLTLSPENSLITSTRGHTVDHSDIGSLLENVSSLSKKGTISIFGEEVVDGRSCFVVRVVGSDGETVDDLSRYDLWIDKQIHLPVKVQSFCSDGELVESVLLKDLRVNVPFPEFFFNL